MSIRFLKKFEFFVKKINFVKNGPSAMLKIYKPLGAGVLYDEPCRKGGIGPELSHTHRSLRVAESISPYYANRIAVIL